MRHLATILNTSALLLALLFSTAYSQEQTSPPPLDSKQVEILSSNIIFGTQADRNVALDALVARGNPDVVATIILALRYQGARPKFVAALKALTGEVLTNWNSAMLWQEAHSEIVPHESFRQFKLRVFRSIDPNFMQFLGEERALRANMKIRLEEITWGGVQKDGIPSLDNPTLIDAAQADYMRGDDLVFGVAINGDVRAYPLRIMGWHEMFNEVIGGVPVALAYCTLCGSGILFETTVAGRGEPLVFGSSGFLYRSNKLMFDRATHTLWNQFTGKPVSGELVNSGIELVQRPVVIDTWANWRAANPDTKILSQQTGYRRDYGSGVVYNSYFSSPDLMFPVVVDERQNRQKDYVFGVRQFGGAKAWPLKAFEQTRVINDGLGDRPLVLIGDAQTRTVRAYERGALEFSGTTTSVTSGDGVRWQITEDALVASDGRELPRVAGHIAFWFAWDGYLGLTSELFDG